MPVEVFAGLTLTGVDARAALPDAVIELVLEVEGFTLAAAMSLSLRIGIDRRQKLTFPNCSSSDTGKPYCAPTRGAVIEARAEI